MNTITKLPLKPKNWLSVNNPYFIADPDTRFSGFQLHCSLRIFITFYYPYLKPNIDPSSTITEKALLKMERYLFHNLTFFKFI